MTTSVVGLLTIGQSPRTDITPSIQSIVGPAVTIIEEGGLNSITDENIHLIAPSDSDTTYISKLRNGNSVKIGKSKLLPLLQTELLKLEEKANVILMLCTGDFPTLKTKKTIIYPDRILNNTVSALISKGAIGLIIPLEEQREKLVAKWEQKNLKLFVEVASPYEESDIEEASRALKERGANIIILDCMGYNELHKSEAVRGSGLPVILPRTLVARIISEYITS